MYIHLGQDVVVPEEDVIGFFDMDTSTISKITRDYLVAAQSGGELVSITADIPKSFAVVAGKNGNRVYLSQLNTSTLLRRSQYQDWDNE